MWYYGVPGGSAGLPIVGRILLHGARLGRARARHGTPREGGGTQRHLRVVLRRERASDLGSCRGASAGMGVSHWLVHCISRSLEPMQPVVVGVRTDFWRVGVLYIWAVALETQGGTGKRGGGGGASCLFGRGTCRSESC